MLNIPNDVVDMSKLFHTSILKNKLSLISPDESTYWPANKKRSPDIFDFP